MQTSSPLHSLFQCPRCGGEHRDLPVMKLTKPILGYPWWQTCPTTGEPILLKPPERTGMDDILDLVRERMVTAVTAEEDAKITEAPSVKPE